jgi:mono/diheme cytochrome c family protein
MLVRSSLAAGVAALLAVVSSATATSPRGGLLARVALSSDSARLYTAAQAERGLTVFKNVCAECHEMEDLTNSDFRQNWDGSTLYELFDLIRTTMPDETPGTLTPQQYVDVTAYILQLNKLPDGDEEFTGDEATAGAVRLALPSSGR